MYEKIFTFKNVSLEIPPQIGKKEWAFVVH